MSLGPEHKKRVIDNARDSIFNAIVPLCGILFFGWSSAVVIIMLFVQVYIIGFFDLLFHIHHHFKKSGFNTILFKQSILGLLEMIIVLSVSTLVFLFLSVFIISSLDDIQEVVLGDREMLTLVNQVLVSALVFAVTYVIRKIKSPKKVTTVRLTRIFSGNFLSKNTLIHFIYYTAGIYVGALALPIAYNFLMKYINFLPNITAQGYGLFILFGVVLVAVVYHGIMILDSIFSDIPYSNS